MILSKCLITIKTLKKYPQGLTLEELAEKIRQEFPSHGAVMWLTLSENWGLKHLVDEDLPCVRQTDGKYYFNPNSKKYYFDNMVDRDIRRTLKEEGKIYKPKEEKLPF